MKKVLMALAAAGTLAITAVAAPQPAEARGPGVAFGILGGLAAGAIIAGAAANNGYYYGGGPAYYGAPPCYWQRERFWDGYGWRVRRVQVCG